MSIQPLNYCRQIRKQFEERLPAYRREDNQYAKEHIELSLQLIGLAQKFVLPVGGMVMPGDKELRGIDETMPLRLPFKTIALEYLRDPNRELFPDTSLSTRSVILAYDYDITPDDDSAAMQARGQEFGGGCIVLRPIAWLDDFKEWMVFPPIMVPREGYFLRSAKTPTPIFYKYEDAVPDADYADELLVFFNFMSAMGCANVRAEKVFTPKRGEKKVINGYAFDSYHMLTVDTRERVHVSGTGMTFGDRHSPREHIRIGHVRRYPNKRIWIQATTVNFGHPGGGKVIKDYAVI